MYSWSELQGQSSLLHKQGSVEFTTTYVTRRKPVWLIALKQLGVAAMIAAGYGLLVPALLQIHLALWQAAAFATGVMMLYAGIAFFVRPEPNTDNLGWGWGGVADDPFQYADDVNRSLWSAQCLLDPGRFTAETFFDTCAILGLAHRDEVLEGVTEAPDDTTFAFPASILCAAGSVSESSAEISPAIAAPGLNPSRFELPPSGRH